MTAGREHYTNIVGVDAHARTGPYSIPVAGSASMSARARTTGPSSLASTLTNPGAANPLDRVSEPLKLSLDAFGRQVFLQAGFRVAVEMFVQFALPIHAMVQRVKNRVVIHHCPFVPGPRSGAAARRFTCPRFHEINVRPGPVNRPWPTAVSAGSCEL